MHVGDNLIGHLFEHLLGEVSHPDGLVETDKLNYVARERLPLGVPKPTAFTVKLLHCRKVGVAQSHHDH